MVLGGGFRVWGCGGEHGHSHDGVGQGKRSGNGIERRVLAVVRRGLVWSGYRTHWKYRIHYRQFLEQMFRKPRNQAVRRLILLHVPSSHVVHPASTSRGRLFRREHWMVIRGNAGFGGGRVSGWRLGAVPW